MRRNLTKISPERGKSGNLIGIVQKEAAKQKIHNNNKTGFCLRKSKITRIWRSFFRRPEIFFGSKNVRTFGTFERGFRVPTTFTFSLIPLIGATWLYQVFAMLGQFSLCFRMILQPKLQTEPCQTWSFSGIREALQLVVPKN